MNLSHGVAPPVPDTRKLSAIVLTLNEERSLPDCLRSLSGLACEVFVVDSGSSDATAAIARAAGAQVVEHAFENYGRQRNWALENLPLTAEWILHLDADERLTPELAAEIAATLNSPQAGVEGYMLRRRTVFRGRWIRHGGHYPNYQLRLFRRGKGRCEDRRYDQHFIVKGTVGRLRHDFIDTAAGDLASWSRRHFRWAAAEAMEQRAAQSTGDRVAASLSRGPISRRRWLRDKLYARAPLFVRPAAYFFYRYILRLGFLDGREGFVFHCLQGFWYRFLVDAMLWEESLRK
jgi:glycosyltransferase involved in cell wall biosynthesis